MFAKQETENTSTNENIAECTTAQTPCRSHSRPSILVLGYVATKNCTLESGRKGPMNALITPVSLIVVSDSYLQHPLRVMMSLFREVLTR
jgi:hypothetical protein